MIRLTISMGMVSASEGGGGGDMIGDGRVGVGEEAREGADVGNVGGFGGCRDLVSGTRRGEAVHLDTAHSRRKKKKVSDSCEARR